MRKNASPFIKTRPSLFHMIKYNVGTRVEDVRDGPIKEKCDGKDPMQSNREHIQFFKILRRQ